MEKLEIGLQFKLYSSKRKDLYTISDILKTYNSKKELVGTVYVCEHDFMGSKIISEHAASSIVRSLSRMNQS